MESRFQKHFFAGIVAALLAALALASGPAAVQESCEAKLSRIPAKPKLERTADEVERLRSYLAMDPSLRSDELQTNLGAIDLSKASTPPISGKVIQLVRENGDQPIRWIELTLPRSADSFFGLETVLPDYSVVLDRDPNLGLVLVVPQSSLGSTQKWKNSLPPLRAARVVLEEAKLYPNDMDWWVQDGSKPATSGQLKQPQLLVPRAQISSASATRYADGIESAKRLGLVETAASPFRFDGGNLVVGAGHVFTGSDIVEAAMRDFNLSRSAAIKALEREFGLPVFEVGTPVPTGGKIQPAFHTDLILAVVRDRTTGLEKVVVEDSGLAVGKVLGAGALRDKSSFETAKSAWIEKGTRPARSPLSATDPAEFLAGLSWENFEYRRIEQAHLRAQIKAQGYEVVLVPGLTDLVPSERGDSFAPPLNYTNVLVGDGYVLMPELGHPGLDMQARAAYRKLGYDVVAMPSSLFLFCANGGTRCAAQAFR